MMTKTNLQSNDVAGVCCKIFVLKLAFIQNHINFLKILAVKKL